MRHRNIVIIHNTRYFSLRKAWRKASNMLGKFTRMILSVYSGEGWRKLYCKDFWTCTPKNTRFHGNSSILLKRLQRTICRWPWRWCGRNHIRSLSNYERLPRHAAWQTLLACATRHILIVPHLSSERAFLLTFHILCVHRKRSEDVKRWSSAWLKLCMTGLHRESARSVDGT